MNLSKDNISNYISDCLLFSVTREIASIVPKKVAQRWVILLINFTSKIRSRIDLIIS